MVVDTVVKEQLTDAMIEVGELLTKKLDDIGFPIRIALWLYLPDRNQWRLYFESPDIPITGPRMVFEQIEKARNLLGEQGEIVPLSMISLLNQREELFQLLLSAVRTNKTMSRIRFSRNVINGHYIDDALIYRNAA